ncbi:uncharacterized protein LOC119154741 [Falco rusticolus]|uniref:uncharacterized protein LOC119154741 n=1 Tax=Falco rusticolus TaxID=120794 RepID=UPI00188666FC|nr:uncharacterized protein LOC119154741 [Falco rusticolus]
MDPQLTQKEHLVDFQPTWKKGHPMDTQPAQEKEHPWDLQPAQEQGHPMDLQLTWEKERATPWPTSPQEKGHLMNLQRAQEQGHPTHTPQHPALHPARFHIFIRKKTKTKPNQKFLSGRLHSPQGGLARPRGAGVPPAPPPPPAVRQGHRVVAVGRGSGASGAPPCPHADALWLVPVGARSAPSAPTCCWGGWGTLWLGEGGGDPQQHHVWVLGARWGACTRVAVRMEGWVHLHAGTHVCTRVRAGTCVCTGLLCTPVQGGTPGCTRLEGPIHTDVCTEGAHRDVHIHVCSPPHGCVHTLKHGNVCIYKYKYIYIHMCTQARVQRTWAVPVRICAATRIHDVGPRVCSQR